MIIPVMREKITEAKNLTMNYGDFTAVDDLSFRVEKGEAFGLLGPMVQAK